MWHDLVAQTFHLAENILKCLHVSEIHDYCLALVLRLEVTVERWVN